MFTGFLILANYQKIPLKTNYEIIPTRNIVFNFNAAGFEVLKNTTIQKLLF